MGLVRRYCLLIAALGGSYLIVASCKSFESMVQLDDVMNPHRYEIVEQDLSAAALAKKMEEIDAQYSEPRSPKKVEYSLETAEVSLADENNYDALWRGARACAWLGMNAHDLAEREAFAAKGISMGLRAIEKQGTRVEPYYYTALSIGSYLAVKRDQGRIPSRKLLVEAKQNAKMAVSLDPTFDHAGPHRFLGRLISKASGTLTHDVGDFDEGLEHLKKAVEIAPDFGQNHLYLAEAYQDDDETELARAELDKVFASPRPRDYTVEHNRWLDEAARLLGRPAPAHSGVDVTGLDQQASESGVDDDAGSAEIEEHDESDAKGGPAPGTAREQSATAPATSKRTPSASARPGA